MASYTTNLNLKKPAGSENVAIGDINSNMDTIDSAVGALNSKFMNSQITSISDLTSYIGTNKIALVRVNTTVGNALSGHNRQGLVIGYEISTEYDAFIFLDSNGETYSGWITVATGAVVYSQL